MSNIKLNTTNGSITLKPENGTGNVDLTVLRGGFGKVLQVVTVSGSGGSDSIIVRVDGSGYNHSSWPVILTTSFTPKSANSKIFVTANANVQAQNGTGGIQFAICEDSSGLVKPFEPEGVMPNALYESQGLWYSSASLSNAWSPITTQCYRSSPGTTPFNISYRTCGENPSSLSYTVTINSRYNVANMVIMEIAN